MIGLSKFYNKSVNLISISGPCCIFSLIGLLILFMFPLVCYFFRFFLSHSLWYFDCYFLPSSYSPFLFKIMPPYLLAFSSCFPAIFLIILFLLQFLWLMGHIFVKPLWEHQGPTWKSSPFLKTVSLDTW